MRGLVKFAVAFGQAAVAASQAQRRAMAEAEKDAREQELHRLRVEREKARIAAESNRVVLLDMKIDTIRATMEAAVASPNNKVVLGDLQIEMQKLKILELARKLGADLPPFKPLEYTPKENP